ncbi:hypothetical protein WME73_17225 [Sorangium sp. So ce302]|uniref:hypothetical protein n=1 Tax=Sorangium sp. So ce302 TaxID=3133297 RepID=UPI003F5F4CE2
MKLGVSHHVEPHEERIEDRDVMGGEHRAEACEHHEVAGLRAWDQPVPGTARVEPPNPRDLVPGGSVVGDGIRLEKDEAGGVRGRSRGARPDRRGACDDPEIDEHRAAVPAGQDGVADPPGAVLAERLIARFLPG